ncbi:hypothetical protein ACOZ4L_02810 [Haloplanus ruber]|uniref:Uncharacterized protein n=1 Tax=Haloplanus ruber TaxID=869892 RepID=A0ABD6D0E7_9EURY|nr:hypothetical protein [Haloplanus ruber]
MAKFQVETDYISDQGLTARRRILLNEKVIETPTAATPIGRAAHQDTPAEESRGVNELHRTVSTKSLKKSMRDESSTIADKLRRNYRKTNDDEVTIAFASYQDAHQIGRQEMEHLADLYERWTDIMSVPLMPELVGSIDTDEGVSDSAFQSYRATLERAIEIYRERVPEMPVMGVIPPLGWEYVRSILDLYGKHNIRAFCLNLNRRRITAGRQVGMVTPLMRHLARRDIADGVLTYLINPNPYGPALSEEIRSAADVASYGMGIDIIGDCHVSPGGFDSDDEAPTTFRLFNKDTYAYEDVLLTNLKDRLPSDTGLDPDRVFQRCKDSPENGLYQMQKLVNMEQIALAGREVQQKSRSDVFDHLTGKAGVTADTQEAYETVRSGFDTGSSQTGLSDF